LENFENGRRVIHHEDDGLSCLQIQKSSRELLEKRLCAILNRHWIDLMTTLKAMTIRPAWEHFEENNKNRIEV